MTYLSTREAAALTGKSRDTLLRWASRCRARGVELQAPREVWVDGRTPLWDEALILAQLGRVQCNPEDYEEAT